MAKEIKRMPFNVGLAKKIQNGDIAGRICTEAGEPAEIIDFELAPDSRFPLGVKYYDCGTPMLSNFSLEGECLADAGTSTTYNTLVLELEIESVESDFEPFDKVLVRDVVATDNRWFPAFYFRFINGMHETLEFAFYKECIPYEGNENIIGTNNEPKSV